MKNSILNKNITDDEEENSLKSEERDNAMEVEEGNNLHCIFLNKSKFCY